MIYKITQALNPQDIGKRFKSSTFKPRIGETIYLSSTNKYYKITDFELATVKHMNINHHSVIGLLSEISEEEYKKLS